VYVVPILVLAFVVAIGAVWSPIFALIIAVPLFVLFLALRYLPRHASQYLRMRRRKAFGFSA
jgi:ABC-type transport system involved in cytochrome bd biosynthesis fused ATPase/permease subunit